MNGSGPVLDYRTRLRSTLLCGLLASAVAVPLVESGYLLGLHALVLIVGPALVLPMGWHDKTLRKLWLLAGLWTAAQLVSNEVNGGDHTAAVTYSGLLTMVGVTALAWMSTQGVSPARAVRAFAVGWVALAIVLGATVDAAGWKYDLAVPVGMVVLATLAHRRDSAVILFVALAAFAVMGVVADGRSLVAFSVGVVFALAARRRLRPAHPVRLAVLAAIGALCLYLAYPSAATAGWLGARAEAQQTSLDALGSNFVVENRAEAFQGVYVVAQNPLLGVGAKQRLPAEVEVGALRWLDQLGVAMTPSREAYLTGVLGDGRGYAPHSAVFDAAIQGGVLSLPFWVAALALIGRGVARYRGAVGGLALLAFAGVAAAWNALFSPLAYSTQMGLVAALFLAWASLRDGDLLGGPPGVAGAGLLDVERRGGTTVRADVG